MAAVLEKGALNMSDENEFRLKSKKKIKRSFLNVICVTLLSIVIETGVIT